MIPLRLHTCSDPVGMNVEKIGKMSCKLLQVDEWIEIVGNHLALEVQIIQDHLILIGGRQLIKRDEIKHNISK